MTKASVRKTRQLLRKSMRSEDGHQMLPAVRLVRTASPRMVAPTRSHARRGLHIQTSSASRMARRSSSSSAGKPEATRIRKSRKLNTIRLRRALKDKLNRGRSQVFSQRMSFSLPFHVFSPLNKRSTQDSAVYQVSPVEENEAAPNDQSLVVALCLPRSLAPLSILPHPDLFLNTEKSPSVRNLHQTSNVSKLYTPTLIR